MSESVNCRKCGSDCSDHHWMCDRSDGAWCDDCFPQTACGKEKHGEGCPTQVFRHSESEEASRP